MGQQSIICEHLFLFSIQRCSCNRSKSKVIIRLDPRIMGDMVGRQLGLRAFERGDVWQSDSDYVWNTGVRAVDEGKVIQGVASLNYLVFGGDIGADKNVYVAVGSSNLCHDRKSSTG